MRDLTVVLRANIGDYTAKLGAAAAQTKAFGKDVTSAVTSTDKATQKAVREVSRGSLLLGGAAVAGFGIAVKTAADFDKAMSGVKAVAGATAVEMGRLREAALDAGAATAFSASQAAQAEAELVKAGISVSDVLGGALIGSLDLAAAGQLDLAQAAEISAQSMNIFGLKGRDVTHIADLLAAGANKSAADVGQLGDALRQGGLVAAQTGLSIEETVGALSAFADRALIGSDAGTSLKTALQRLTPQSVEAANLMDHLGFSAYDAQGNFIGLANLAQELQDSLGNLTVEQRNQAMGTLFGSDAIRGMNVLFEIGADGVRDYTEAVDDQGAAARMAATQLDNLSGDLEGLRGSIETALIKSGSGGTTVLREMAQATTGLVNRFNEMPEAAQTAAGGIVAVSGSTLLVLGGLGTLIPKIQEARRALDALGAAGVTTNRSLGFLGRMGAAAAGIGAVVVGVELLAQKFTQVTKGTVNLTELGAALVELGESGRLTGELARQFGSDLGGLADKLDLLSEHREGLLDPVQELKQGFGLFGSKARDAKDDIDALDKQLAHLVDTGHIERARSIFDQLTDAVVRHGGSAGDLRSRVNDYADAITRATTQDRLAADATGEMAAKTGVAAAASGDLTEQIEAEEQAAKDLHARLEDLGEAFGSFTAPTTAWEEVIAKNREVAETTAAATKDASDSWTDFYDGVTVSTEDWIATMQRQIDAQQEWASNLAQITLRGRHDVATTLAAMGPEGADLAARFADLTGEEFQRAADLFVQTTGDGAEDAGARLDRELQVMAAIGRRGAQATAHNIANEMNLGADEVASIAAKYGQNLAAGINPVLLGIGKQAIHGAAGALGFATGGPVPGHGDGDTVPAMLTPGEFVIRKAAVRAVGVDRLHRLNRADQIGVQHFAAGGEVQGYRSPEDVPRPPDVSRYGTMLGAAAGAVMDHAFAAVVEFVKANAAPMLGSGVGYQAMMTALRSRFPGLPLISGLRPGAITRSGNRSLHADGRAVDIPPRLDVNHWIADNYGPQTLELILTQRGAVNLKNGRAHTYSAGIQADHVDHNHWAMANGGTGVVTRPTTFLAGEAGPEAFSFVPLHLATGGLVERAAGDVRFRGAVTDAGIRAAAAAGFGRGLDPTQGLPLLREMGETYADVAFAVDEATARTLLNLGLTAEEFQATARQVINLNAQMVEAAEERARREADLQQEISRNAREMWFAGSPLERQIEMLDEWIAAETAYTDEWRRLVEQRQDVIDAETERLDEQARARHEALDARAGQIGRSARSRIDARRRIADERQQAAEAQRDADLEAFAARTRAEQEALDAERGMLADSLDGLEREWTSHTERLEAIHAAALDASRRQHDDYQRTLVDRNRRIGEEMARFSTSIAGPVQRTGDLIATFGTRGFVTGDEIVATLRRRVDAARQWGDTLRTLAASGLQSDLITRLAQAGPDAGGLARGLLGVDPQTVNGLLGELDRLGGTLGDWFTDRERDSIVGQVAADLPLPELRSFNELLTQQTQVLAAGDADRAAMRDWATSMATAALPALRSELDATSAALTRLSTVTPGAGAIPAGFATKGLEGKLDQVIAAIGDARANNIVIQSAPNPQAQARAVTVATRVTR